MSGYAILRGASSGVLPCETHLSWHSGRRFEEPPPRPVVAFLDPDAPGEPPLAGAPPAFLDAGVPFLSAGLIASLVAAGVDNLDCYDALLRHPVTGEELTRYRAVNVVGVIAAARMDGPRLAVDAAKARGALLFRLAETTAAIAVHERVWRRLKAEGFPGLELVDPADVSG